MTWWQQGLVALTVSLVSSGSLVLLFTLRQQRRKLGADADVGLATAADTLTGTALQLVQHAEQRAGRAEAKADQAEIDAQEAQRLANLAQQRLSKLVAWIRTQGMNPPDWVEQ
jgi:hypothetical protein